MYSIYVDDERNPNGKFDIICRTTNDAVKAVRRKYKEGVRHFYLDLDHDAGLDSLTGEHGGDFINVLKQIDAYVNMGRMRDLDIEVSYHTGNPVGRENMHNFVTHTEYMRELL